MGTRTTIRIERLAAGGRGVARADGLVWFVDGAVPGDVVVAEALRRRPRYVEARLDSIVEPSDGRRTAPCPIQGRCGGCPWMPLDEAEQRRWKREIVIESLARIGGLADVEVAPVTACPPELRYRNRLELSVGDAGTGRAILGLHARDGGLVDVERCLLGDEVLDGPLVRLRELLLGGARPLAPPPRGELRVSLRRSTVDGSVLVGLREAGARFPRAAALARRLVDEEPAVVGVVRLVAEPGRRGGVRVVPLAGRDTLAERVAGFDIELPPATFLQVHPAGAERLVAEVRRAAGDVPGRRLFDLFGGIGLYALTLRRDGAAARAVVVEADGAAVAAGRAAARRHGLAGVRWVRGDVARFVAERAERGGGAGVDLVVANPPRGGLGRSLARRIGALAAPRIVLVSCEPSGLARDLAELVASGYRVGSVVPIDLFPQTAHVETVVALERAAGVSRAAHRRPPRASSRRPAGG